jgi:hypothetical protein
MTLINFNSTWGGGRLHFIHDSHNAIVKARQEGMKEKAIAIARELLDVLDMETIS